MGTEVSGGEVDGHLGGETSAGGNETSAVNPPSVHKKFHQKVHMGNETEAGGGNETTAVGGKEPKADLEDESKGLKGKESYGFGGGDGGFAALAKLSKTVDSLHKITSNLGTGKGHQ